MDVLRSAKCLKGSQETLEYTTLVMLSNFTFFIKQIWVSKIINNLRGNRSYLIHLSPLQSGNDALLE